MQIKPFFVIFIALVGTVIYAYYAPKQKPEKATTLTPKQYIELVEEKKKQRKVNEAAANSTAKKPAIE